MTLLIFLYILGCILSYFKVVACLADDAKATTVWKFLKYAGCTPLIVILLSWLGFFVGTIASVAFSDQFFFKWSPKDHR